MDASVTAVQPWSFEHPIGELRQAMFSGRVDVSHPEIGLHDLELSGRKLAGRLLCVHRHADTVGSPAPDREAKPAWPLPIADAYVRAGDLVAGYLPSDGWPYAPQIYWRADTLEPIDGVIGSLSLLVSVQTHLLDTCPRIGIGSQLACTETLSVSAGEGKNIRAELLKSDAAIQTSTGACCIVRRLADVPISYAEIMPASDFRKVAVWRDDGRWHVEWELFADFLEKGVIRRARLQSAFLPRADDVQLAAACCEAIEQRPLPLTT
jgi:hypothetical protein